MCIRDRTGGYHFDQAEALALNLALKRLFDRFFRCLDIFHAVHTDTLDIGWTFQRRQHFTDADRLALRFRVSAIR